MFAETLPNGCPPSDAIESDGRMAIRLLKSPNPTEKDFYSHAKLGKRKPESVSFCVWASCSLSSIQSATNLPKLPKLRGKDYYTKIILKKESGMLKVSDSGHIDFWMYATFDPVGASTGVWRIDP